MLRDIEYFQSRLGKIDGFEDASEYLTNIVKSKEIKSAAAPAATPAAADNPEEKQPSEGGESPATDTNSGTEKMTEELAAQVGSAQTGS
jgi:vacuolar protein sorting-associated protein 54